MSSLRLVYIYNAHCTISSWSGSLSLSAAHIFPMNDFCRPLPPSDHKHSKPFFLLHYNSASTAFIFIFANYIFPLVNLDWSINSSVEPKRGAHTHKSCEQKQSERNQRHVSKVKNICCELIRLQLLEICTRVKENVQSCRSGTAERTPPPMIILSTKLKVVK